MLHNNGHDSGYRHRDYDGNFADSTIWSRRVMDYLAWTCDLPVDDLTNDLGAQVSGIDFRVNDVGVEFKLDHWMNRTRNVELELVSNSRKATPGWALYSKAELLLVFDVVGEVCHVYRLPALRRALETCDQGRFAAHKSTTRDRRGGVLYATYGLLIPNVFVDQFPEVEHATFVLGDAPARVRQLFARRAH